MSKSYTQTALVLAAYPLGEADLRLRIFSGGRGLQTVVAKSAKKPKSSLRGLCQPPSLVNIELAASRGGMDILKQGELLEGYLQIKADFDKTAAAAYLSELILAAQNDNEPSEGVLELAQAVLALLEYANRPSFAVRVFEARYLTLLGLLPELGGCVGCGAKQEEKTVYLSVSEGGLLCAACRAQNPDQQGFNLSLGSVKTLLRLLVLPFDKLTTVGLSAAADNELGEVLGEYLQYHLGCRLKSRRFLQLSAKTL